MIEKWRHDDSRFKAFIGGPTPAPIHRCPDVAFKSSFSLPISTEDGIRNTLDGDGLCIVREIRNQRYPFIVLDHRQLSGRKKY